MLDDMRKKLRMPKGKVLAKGRLAQTQNHLLST